MNMNYEHSISNLKLILLVEVTPAVLLGPSLAPLVLPPGNLIEFLMEDFLLVPGR